MRPLAIIPFPLILVSLTVDIASAQVPARVATPYTLMDDETRRTSTCAWSSRRATSYRS